MPPSRLFLSAALLLLLPAAAQAQLSQPEECGVTALRVCALHIVKDEAAIVTSPLRFSKTDWLLVVPFGVATGIALEKDTDVANRLGVDPQREQRFTHVADALTYGSIGATGVGYVAGAITHNDHLRRSAVVAGEAMIDATLLNEGLKYAIDRQTPKEGDGTGRFWPHGTRTWPDGQSMPSGHCITTWSFAHAVANQYPGWGTKLVVYSMASTVSVSRIMGRDHFPSDVIVGSTLGYVIGGFVSKHRGDGVESNLSLAPVSTPNGRGIELSYSFSGKRAASGN